MDAMSARTQQVGARAHAHLLAQDCTSEVQGLFIVRKQTWYSAGERVVRDSVLHLCVLVKFNHFVGTRSLQDIDLSASWTAMLST